MKVALQRVKEEDPVRYERELQIRKLEEESRDLGRSIRKSKDESEKKQLRADLNKLLSNLFDLRELNRQDEIDRLRAELERLQQTLAKRQKNKVAIVERRLKQLTGEADDLDW